MIFKGQKAKEICEAILGANPGKTEDFTAPMPDNLVYSAGYWKDEENGKWIAYDNTDHYCWVEEFETEKQAKSWVE